MAEVGCYYKAKGMSVYEGLQSLYKKYGYYVENTVSTVFTGYDAQDKMNGVMSTLRDDVPDDLGMPVVEITDYLKDIPGFTKSNVLFYHLDDGCAVAIRPSGTEPKVKTYVMTQGASAEEAKDRCETVKAAVGKLLEA
jgi:phosphoglucomutase